MNVLPQGIKAWFSIQQDKLRRDTRFALRQTHTLSLVFRHPDVPWHAKGVAAFAMLYVVSPIQLIPTFIPIIGQMDDLFVLWVGMKLVRKFTPKKVLMTCEEQADLRPTPLATQLAVHVPVDASSSIHDREEILADVSD